MQHYRSAKALRHQKPASFRDRESGPLLKSSSANQLYFFLSARL